MTGSAYAAVSRMTRLKKMRSPCASKAAANEGGGLLQAKTNASKYTGVSSEDLKSGGFGLKSSGFGSTTTSSSFGLPRKYSGGGLGSTGFGSGTLSSSFHDYDEPYDAVRAFLERL